MSRRPSLLTHPLLGLLGADASAGKIYPATSAAFAAKTGVTPTAIYVFDEASGSLDDKVGSADLAVTGAPTFNSSKFGRRGIKYDSAGEKHSADVHAVGTASFIYGCVFVNETAASDGIMGRGNATVAEWAAMWVAVPGSGLIQASVRDSGAGAANVGNTIDTRTTGTTLALMQVDRTAAVLRLRLSNGRFLEQPNTASVSGHATYDGASQEFTFGAVPGVTAGGIWVGYGFVVLGAGAEGANTPRDISRGLGFE